jgi:serine/threonine protein kinase
MREPSDPRSESGSSTVGERPVSKRLSAEKPREPTALLPEELAEALLRPLPLPISRQPTPEQAGAVPYRPPIRPPELFSEPEPAPPLDEPGVFEDMAPAAVRWPRAESSEPSEDLEPGDMLGSYQIIELLAKGGMGAVYKGRDDRLGRVVAIKVVLTDDKSESQRLLREAQATAKVSHPNIVSIFDVGEHNGKPYIVYEYVRGKSLQAILAEAKRLPERRAVEMARALASALTEAHFRGVVHRDLKPANIVISSKGVLKLLDLGIAKVTGVRQSRYATMDPLARPVKRQPSELEVAAPAGPADLTGKGVLLGTLAYMAPEQWRNPDAVDARADIYAFGVILYMMLTGHHPADPEGVLQGMDWAGTALRPEPLPRLGPEFNKDLADICARCLEKDRQRRFRDALALLKALEEVSPGRGSLKQPNVDQCPYPGLASFQESDAAYFFGREAATAELVTRVRDRPLTILTANSGVGKSSLARAALAPALKGSGEGWEVIFIRPGRDPVGALAAAVSPMLGTPTSATIIDGLISENDIARTIRKEPGFPGRILRAYGAREQRRILVCIDQFEEVYTLGAEGDRSLFSACLAGIADDPSSPLRLLITIRADHLPPLAEDPRLGADIGPALFFLAPADARALREALEGPARAVGYSFEEGIVDSMLNHLQSTTAALPLLQFSAEKLWAERNTASRLITGQSYQDLGGIAGALSRHADSVVGSLSPKLQHSARELFLRLVTPQRTGAVVPLSTLQELPNGRELVEQLVRARLLVIERSERDESTVELAHDSLIQNWGTLARWIDDAGQDMSFLEHLGAAARLWSANSRDVDLLWRGDMLEDAKRFQKRFRGELSKAEHVFLEEALALEAKSVHRRRRMVAVSMAFLALLVAASFVALAVIASSRLEAQRQARAAEQAAVEAKRQADMAKRAEETATREAAVAAAAEAQARERLAEVQEKERERAEAARRAEEAREEVKQVNDYLQVKNRRLLEALERADESRRQAKRAKDNAEARAAEARKAREEVIRAAKELEKALQVERERVRRLEDQLGGNEFGLYRWQKEL